MTTKNITENESLTPNKAMHIGLWIVQALLAAAFGMAGAMKLGTPTEELVKAGMTWVQSAPAFAPPLIGALELLGAAGLILPSLLRIKPKLTVAAAGGLVLTMVGALLVHIVLGETHALGAPIVLGGLAAFVAWGRSKKTPIVQK